MIMYDRKTLLDIGQCYTNLIQDTLSTDPAWPLEILRNNELNNDHLNNREAKKHCGDALEYATDWGKGLTVPSTEYSTRQCPILGDNMDDLKARISFQREIRDCNILVWPKHGSRRRVPDTAVMPSDNFSVLRMDRTAEAGNTKGWSVFFINKNGCDPRNISILSRPARLI